MAFTDHTAQLVNDLRRQYTNLTDQRARQLVEAWVRAWDVLSVEWQTTVADLLTITPGQWPTRAQILRAERVLAALEHTTARLEELAAQARVNVAADARTAVDQGARDQVTVIASQLPGSLAGSVAHRVAQDALDAIVERVNGRVTSLTRPLAGDATTAMKAALIRGVDVGDNPTTTARFMVRGLETRFNGGLTRALTIARTETLDAYRTAAAAQHHANADVLQGWRWLCDLSARTCPACLALNGTEHDLSEAGPDGHPNCRCARVPVTKSWADLGIDLPEPADTFPDARAWYDAQPAQVQRHIMGAGRAQALADGTLTWDQVAVLRHNTGWRDSWQTAPLPKTAA